MHIVVTRGIKSKMDADKGFLDFVDKSLERLFNGDWGDCYQEDAKSNDEALETGARILAVYKHDTYPTIWIIVEALNDNGEREYTTVLFPSEY